MNKDNNRIIYTKPYWVGDNKKLSYMTESHLELASITPFRDKENTWLILITEYAKEFYPISNHIHGLKNVGFFSTKELVMKHFNDTDKILW